MSPADIYGFDPFPSRFPGQDFMPGPLTAWTPYTDDVSAAIEYASQLFLGQGDRGALFSLEEAGIGGARPGSNLPPPGS